MNAEKPSLNPDTATANPPINPNKKGARNLKIMVLSALVLAFVILGFGLWLYQKNGTYLLDLSRPGYQPATEITPVKDDWSFPPSGDLKQSDFQNFTEHLNQKLEKLKSANAFSDEPLSEESLGF
jgi:hypothetical protein